MSEYLPAVQRPDSSQTPAASRPPSSESAIKSLLGSSLAKNLAAALPDVVRLIGRRQPEPVHRSFVSGIVPRSDGASGMTLSEVEVDIDAPFIRRVVIRSASSWSVSPTVIQQQQSRRTGRFTLGALTVGMLGVAGVVVARRFGLSLPLDRFAPALTGQTGTGRPARESPGLAD